MASLHPSNESNCFNSPRILFSILVLTLGKSVLLNLERVGIQKLGSKKDISSRKPSFSTIESGGSHLKTYTKIKNKNTTDVKIF